MAGTVSWHGIEWSRLGKHPLHRRPQKTQWQKQDDFKAKLQKGYQIQKFKITEDDCYEIYGKDKSGKKVEIYFNPTNGDVVKQKGE